MAIKQIVRIVLSLCMGGILVLQGCGKPEDPRFKEYQTLNPQKDFTLTDQNGQPFHLKDHRGELVFLFFGYLSCPDVCPTTLSKLAGVYSLLGSFKGKVLTVFVSVDPLRDTPARLKEYLEYFNIRSVGLTGTKEQLDLVVNAYKATYEKVETGSAVGYLFNHSDYVYLIDPQGMVRYLIRPEDKPQKIADIIKVILK